MSDLPVAGAATPTIETQKDLGTGKDAAWRFWIAQLTLAKNADHDFILRGRAIVERYRDERADAQINTGNVEPKYNILWANTETLRPVLYGRTPKPDAQRRHKNQPDPAADMGADILQRALEWEDDIEEFDDVMQQVVEDRLLPGRGVARVFYEAQFGPEEGGPETDEEEQEFTAAGSPLMGGSPVSDDQLMGGGGPMPPAMMPGGSPPAGLPIAPVQQPYQPVKSERAPVRYVFWEDYRESPARTEQEIWWKGYRSFLTRDQLTDRFGPELGKIITLDYTPSGVQAFQAKGGPLPDTFKKATIWEIWNLRRREVVWLAESYSDQLLDTLEDPLELPGFFPSPRCLRANTTNNKRTPVADFVQYQDQANELDALTTRIDRLTRALRVVGVYPGSEKAILTQLFEDASENKVYPVEDWAAFAGDKGGLNAMIQWVPVQQIADVMLRLYDARDRILQIIYQTTGIADILRGETDPSETLGAQQLKSRFATRRISQAQKDVARFARDLMRLRGAVIARHFGPETLSMMTGLPLAMPAMPPAPAMLIPAPAQPALLSPPGVGTAGGPAGAPGASGAPPVPAEPPPVLGARKAPDGQWYVPDPNRAGKYRRVVPRGAAPIGGAAA